MLDSEGSVRNERIWLLKTQPGRPRERPSTTIAAAATDKNQFPFSPLRMRIISHALHESTCTSESQVPRIVCCSDSLRKYGRARRHALHQKTLTSIGAIVACRGIFFASLALLSDKHTMIYPANADAFLFDPNAVDRYTPLCMRTMDMDIVSCHHCNGRQTWL